MTRAWLAACTGFVVACSGTSSGMLPQEDSDGRAAGKELIPAEWTVAEDTSESGHVTTVSLQLPHARDIAGLLDEGAPRLILRCLDGRVGAFIDTGFPGEDGAPGADSQLVQVQLDAAPNCE